MPEKKNTKKWGWTLLLGCVFFAAAFSSCTNAGNSGEDGPETIPLSGFKIKGGSGSVYTYKYIDLETMEVLEETESETYDSDEWDIRVTGARELHTNSGATRPSGSGGVAFTGSTDFNAAVNNPSGLDYGADYTYWEYYEMSAGGYSEPKTYQVNVMNFPGYIDENGYNDGAGDGVADGETEDTAYFRDNIDFSKGNAFAKWRGMPPSFFDYSMNVYVIRSGDGNDYYKLQIHNLEFNTEVRDDGTKKVTYVHEVLVEKIE